MSLKTNAFSVQINPYILEIKKKAYEFSKTTPNKSTVKFIWIPSHIGILGNEMADCNILAPIYMPYVCPGRALCVAPSASEHCELRLARTFKANGRLAHLLLLYVFFYTFISIKTITCAISV